jgi:hypothetical protein
MLLNELFQLGYQVRRTTQRKVRLDPILRRLDPKLLQCGDGSLRERLVHEVGQGRPPPEGQGRRKLCRPHLRGGATRLVDQALEPVGVDGVRLDREPVAASGRLEQAGPCLGSAWLEHTPQPRHQTMDDRPGRRGRTLAPQLVDEPVGRDWLTGMKHEQSEEGPSAPRRERDPPPPVQDLGRSEDPELHRSSSEQTVAPVASGRTGAH